MSDNDYTATQIHILEGFEAVRRRPGMYLGDVEEDGLHEMIDGLFAHALEHVSNQPNTHVHVTLHENQSITVTNNRALPTKPYKDTGQPLFDVLFQMIYGGSSYSKKLWTLNYAVLNALCIRTHVDTWIDGKRWSRTYICGSPASEIKVDQHFTAEWPQGTRVTCKPDIAIFLSNRFQEERIQERCQHLAALSPGSHFTFTNKEGESETFHYPQGMEALLNSPPNGSMLHFQAKTEDFALEVYTQVQDSPKHTLRSFMNSKPMLQGTHIQGFLHGLLAAVRQVTQQPSAELDQLYGVDAVLRLESLSDSWWPHSLRSIGDQELFHWVKEQTLQACQQPTAQRLLSSVYLPTF